jgi:DNA invertase Pin-like site-specific DNA recombinase
MNKKRSENKRYICLVRASDTSEGTTSTEAQLELLKEYGQRMGMHFVDEIVLNGVTGSLPGKREDLSGLLARKREKDDYDVVILQRLDRLTRGGSAHGFWFEHECRCVGVELVFVGDDIPEGRYANLIKVAKYEAAQEQAFSISQRSTQGAQLALEEGRNVTSAHTPYGCWRLYLTADQKPSHIIADLRDGRQQKLDPYHFNVIDTYGQIGGGSKGHYRKQKNERVLLTPGFVEESAVVREIFDLHFRKGWGGKRIADLLNRRGVRSPHGKQWSQHQVEVLYEQEAYTGRSIGNRSSSAIYHERHSSAPKRVDLDAAIQATASNIPVRQRPISEWFVQNQPLMQHFLHDPELREMAMAEHERIWKRRGDVDRIKRSKSKHQASEYLLTGLLFAKQDGEDLVGVLCGRVGKKVRYYRHRRGNRDYRKGGIFSRMVQAKPLEDAVVELVSQMLMNDMGLRDRIMAAIETESTRAVVGDPLAELQHRRELLKRRTTMLVSNLDEETLNDARSELDRLKAERRSLEEQIAAAESASAMRSIDPTAVADAVLSQLRKMAQNIGQMPTFAVRQLLNSVVSRVVIDMETKAVEVQLIVPLGENFSGGLVDTNAMRPVGTSASSTCDETHPPFRVELGLFYCIAEKTSGRRCYSCSRAA